MTPTVENPACRPEEQRREQKSQNGPSSQDEKDSQNYDGDGEKEKSEQENDKGWSASDALQNPAKPHPPTPAESAKRKRSGCPPTGEPHQTQQKRELAQTKGAANIARLFAFRKIRRKMGEIEVTALETEEGSERSRDR